ncbi:peptide-methionine (R)-S-oxide reductase MsrB [Peptoniphilaceae bacterium SGI.131]
MKETVYFAAGCFWGSQAYFDKIDGVLETQVGYANGILENPTYEQVCSGATGCAEVVKLVFDNKIINLYQLLTHLFRIIDPTLYNRQGNDVGKQYRSGVYTTSASQNKIVEDFFDIVRVNYDKDILTENLPLENYYPAEEYHQKYLEKNPGGYCHVDLSILDEDQNQAKFEKMSDERLREELTELQYEVTQKSATERPFTSEYENFYEKGIYVDIVTGEPLFASSSKFDSGCGWPSFSKPIQNNTINYYEDLSIEGRRRIEVKSKIGDSHLGHVFNDGPKELGGLRYCINGASLKFIPLEDMEKEGYTEYINLVE